MQMPAAALAAAVAGGAAALAGGACACCALSDTRELRLQSAAAAAGSTPTASASGPQSPRPDLQCTWVVGHSGSGKTTTAARLAEELGALLAVGETVMFTDTSFLSQLKHLLKVEGGAAE